VLGGRKKDMTVARRRLVVSNVSGGKKKRNARWETVDVNVVRIRV
jgi:hypothetical protein